MPNNEIFQGNDQVVPSISPDSWRHTFALTWVLSKRVVSAEYRGTVLGRIWSLINPLVTIAVFAVIFGVVFRGGVEPGVNSGIDSFALWIGIGVLCWGYLIGVINDGMGALVGNSGLLTKVYFPRYVLVLSATIARTFDFLFELAVLVAVTTVMGGLRVLLFIPLLLVILLVTGVFSFGLALFLSIATVYFRDITHLWGIFAQVWMYASGVVFPLTMLKSAQEHLFENGWGLRGKPLPLDFWFRLNPAELILEAFRAVLYDYMLPSPEICLGVLGWTAFTLLLGILTYRKFSPRIVEEL